MCFCAREGESAKCSERIDAALLQKKGRTDSEVEKEKVEVKEKRWRDGERGTRKDGAGRRGEREEEL